MSERGFNLSKSPHRDNDICVDDVEENLKAWRKCIELNELYKETREVDTNELSYLKTL